MGLTVVDAVSGDGEGFSVSSLRHLQITVGG